MRVGYLFLIIFLVVLASCSEKNNKEHSTLDSKEQTNVSKDNHDLPAMPDTLTLVSSGQMSFYKTTLISGIPFRIVKSNKGDTVFLATWDKTFLTPEGYRVGMSYQKIKKQYGKKLQEEPGWGYYIELPSKWSLQFHIGETATEHPPFDTSKVTFIFKRR